MPSSQRFTRRELHHSGRRNLRMTGRPTRTSLAAVHLFGLRRLWIANPSAPTIAPPPIESATVRIAILLAKSRLNWAAGRGEEMTGTSPKAGPQAGRSTDAILCPRESTPKRTFRPDRAPVSGCVPLSGCSYLCQTVLTGLDWRTLSSRCWHRASRSVSVRLPISRRRRR